MATSSSDASYHATVRELPNEERPRERLERYGAASLTNPELLAIILRVGIQGENVIELSSRLLRKYGGLGGLLGADLDVLRAERGLGSAKAITLKAALEVGRRLTLLDSTERPQILGPGDVATLLALDLGFQSQEQLRVLCLKAATLSADVTITPALASKGKPYGSITLTGSERERTSGSRSDNSCRARFNPNRDASRLIASRVRVGNMRCNASQVKQ